MPKITAFLSLVLVFCLSACMTTGRAVESEKLHGLWKDEQWQFLYLEECGRLSLLRNGERSGVVWNFNGTDLTLETVVSPGAEAEQKKLIFQKRGLFSAYFFDESGKPVKWSRSFKRVKSLEGTLFFRERMMLPPEVTVSVQLKGKDGTVIGQSIASASGHAELAFRVDYLASDHKNEATLEAAVFYGSEPLFASPDGTVVKLDERPAVLLHHAVPSKLVELPLKDTYWRLKELDGKPAEHFADQPEAHLILRDKGKATGSDGCNNFFMNWEGEGESISFQPGGATLRICPNGAEQAQKMLQMVPSVKLWNIAGGQLELRSEDKVAAVFEAVEM